MDTLTHKCSPYRCGVEITLELIGGKWKGIILWHLAARTLRFSQLQRRMAGITQKMLTQQLRDLERDGLIVRTVYAEVPPRVEYALTQKGASLKSLLSEMREWGEQYGRGELEASGESVSQPTSL